MIFLPHFIYMSNKGPLVGLTIVHKIQFVSCTRASTQQWNSILLCCGSITSPHNRVKGKAKMQVITRSLEAQPHRSQRILKPSTPSNTHLSPKGYKGGHLVFGSPATQIPVNPKARHSTSVTILSQMNKPSFDAVLTHLIFEKPARRRLPPEFSKSSAPKDTHFVSGLHYQLNTTGKSHQEKVKTRWSKQSTMQKASSIDQCFLNLLSFSYRRQNSNFFEQVCLKLNSTSDIAF